MLQASKPIASRDLESVKTDLLKSINDFLRLFDAPRVIWDELKLDVGKGECIVLMHNCARGETENFFCATGFLDEFKSEGDGYQSKNDLYKRWNGDAGWQEDITKCAEIMYLRLKDLKGVQDWGAYPYM